MPVRIQQEQQRQERDRVQRVLAQGGPDPHQRDGPGSALTPCITSACAIVSSGNGAPVIRKSHPAQFVGWRHTIRRPTPSQIDQEHDQRREERVEGGGRRTEVLPGTPFELELQERLLHPRSGRIADDHDVRRATDLRAGGEVNRDRGDHRDQAEGADRRRQRASDPRRHPVTLKRARG